MADEFKKIGRGSYKGSQAGKDFGPDPAKVQEDKDWDDFTKETGVKRPQGLGADPSARTKFSEWKAKRGAKMAPPPGQPKGLSSIAPK